MCYYMTWEVWWGILQAASLWSWDSWKVAERLCFGLVRSQMCLCHTLIVVFFKNWFPLFPPVERGEQTPWILFSFGAVRLLFVWRSSNSYTYFHVLFNCPSQNQSRLRAGGNLSPVTDFGSWMGGMASILPWWLGSGTLSPTSPLSKRQQARVRWAWLQLPSGFMFPLFSCINYFAVGCTEVKNFLQPVVGGFAVPCLWWVWELLLFGSEGGSWELCEGWGRGTLSWVLQTISGIVGNRDWRKW